MSETALTAYGGSKMVAVSWCATGRLPLTCKCVTIELRYPANHDLQRKLSTAILGRRRK